MSRVQERSKSLGHPASGNSLGRMRPMSKALCALVVSVHSLHSLGTGTRDPHTAKLLDQRIRANLTVSRQKKDECTLPCHTLGQEPSTELTVGRLCCRKGKSAHEVEHGEVSCLPPTHELHDRRAPRPTGAQGGATEPEPGVGRAISGLRLI